MRTAGARRDEWQRAKQRAASEVVPRDVSPPSEKNSGAGFLFGSRH